MTKETRDNIRDLRTARIVAKPLLQQHGVLGGEATLEPEKAPRGEATLSICSKKFLEDGFQLGSYDECVALLGLEMARAWWVA
jgi:hypothetical protein